MFAVIKKAFTSLKFWMVIVGSAVCAGMTYFGVSPELIAIVGGLFGVGVAGQGLADFGKNSPK